MSSKIFKAIIFDIVGVLFDYPDVYPGKKIKDPAEFKPVQETIKLLNQLPDYDLFIISNMSNENFAWLQKHYPEIMSHFKDAVISSCGYKKPNLKIFNHFLNKTNLIPQECIFIDDQAANIEAAQALGIESILFDRNTIDRDLLRVLNK